MSFALGDELRGHNPAYSAVGNRERPSPTQEAGEQQSPQGAAGTFSLVNMRVSIACSLAAAGVLAFAARQASGRVAPPWGPSLRSAGVGGHRSELSQLTQDRDLLVVMKSEPYDCGAGFNNWEAGWSTAKKEWCCINKGMGCTVDAEESWLVCDSEESCNDNSFLQKWDRSPRELASAVADDLSSVPGVPEQVWKPVIDRWTADAPHFNGRAVWLEDVAAFMRQLLADDPFGTGDSVPYIDFWGPSDGKVVAVTQRQLAFIVANVIMGNTIPAGDGLTAAIRRCSDKSPAPTDFALSLLSMLAVLSQELRPGQAGTTLIGTMPRAGDLGGWKDRLGNQTLKRPRVQMTIGDKTTGSLEDFMSGGVPFQALTDIAGAEVGGGAELCFIANSQDESLVQFYSEVLAFVFWTSEGRMLPVPWTLMGARRYLSELSGESRSGEPFYNSCGLIHEKNWLNQDIPSAATSVKLGNKKVLVMASSFVALKSVATPLGACGVGEAMNHNCQDQRNHLDDDVSMWYQAYEPSMYPSAVREAFGGMVRHIGTGPWGAGVWWGDSQMYFLTVWLATSLLQGATLDYYLYDHFCENPANQCFVLGDAGCGDCISTASVDGSPIDAGRCGSQSIWGIVDRFQNAPAQDLYQALMDVGGPPAQVFDLLAPGSMEAPEDPTTGERFLQDERLLIQPVPASASRAASTPAPRPAAPDERTPEDVPIWSPAAAPASPELRASEEPRGPQFKYSFAGYHDADSTESACGSYAVAMPKTAEERDALKEAMLNAIEAGDMEEAWPKNTIWIGAQWSSGRWEWHDGDAALTLDWADGQPSSAGSQEDEPYLCMVTEGKIHDSAAGSPPYVFGVMCQAPIGSAETTVADLVKVDEWPVHEPVDNDFKDACLAGNNLVDGWKYIFNSGRGTAWAACGESAEYWCCKRRSPSSAGDSARSSASPGDFWQKILTR